MAIRKIPSSIAFEKYAVEGVFLHPSRLKAETVTMSMMSVSERVAPWSRLFAAAARIADDEKWESALFRFLSSVVNRSFDPVSLFILLPDGEACNAEEFGNLVDDHGAEPGVGEEGDAEGEHDEGEGGRASLLEDWRSEGC